MDDNRYNRPPWWMTVVILIMLLPLFSWPMVIASLPPEEDGGNWKMLIYIFPVYAILSAYYAYRCYDGRRELSVILLSVLLLSYLGVAFALLV
ncbi:MAG: hypothetical protein K2L31_10725 [Muribaculum sp.]|nr:hypothetical protein [Muribaculum sp.]